MCVDMHVPWQSCEGQGTTLWNWFCLFTVWVPGHRSSGLKSHLDDPGKDLLGLVSFKFKSEISWSAELGGSTGILYTLVSFLL